MVLGILAPSQRIRKALTIAYSMMLFFMVGNLFNTKSVLQGQTLSEALER
jgi:hypothetical protein